MSSIMPAGAGALLKHSSFLFFLLSRSLSRFSSQIGAVAIGWQIYDLTGSAFDLGMVGLVQFLPTALLVFVAGHAADRYERKRVVQICQLAEALTALFLAWGAYAGWLTVAQIFTATFVLGIAGAFESPATAALLPLIAPQGSLQRATAISSGAAQIATITGPALGGLAYAIAPSVPYGIMVAFWLLGGGPDRRHPPDAAGRRQGCRRRRTICLPASASSATIRRSWARSRSICSRCCSAAPPRCCRSMRATSCRPARWASASCAPRPRSARLLMTAVLARHTINRRVGMRMFQAVIVFGVATVVFALSHWMWLSVLALAILGAADTVSVVIRFSLVQLATPDEMRGRVGAVNFLFINASNQLGQFESGVTAALFGADAGRRARRRRHDRDRAVVDEAVPDAARCGAAGVGDVRAYAAFAAYAIAVTCGASRRSAHPRPTNGILLAMTVMNSTLASSGRPAM